MDIDKYKIGSELFDLGGGYSRIGEFYIKVISNIIKVQFD